MSYIYGRREKPFNKRLLEYSQGVGNKKQRKLWSGGEVCDYSL